MMFRRVAYILSLLIAADRGTAGIAVVTHKSSKVSPLTIEQVRQIYLGKTPTFSSGKEVVPSDRTAGTPLFLSFLKVVVEKSEEQYRAYWSIKVFSGRGIPPKVVSSDEQLKAWLAENPNGIGYLDSSLVDSSTKVLLTLP